MQWTGTQYRFRRSAVFRGNPITNTNEIIYFETCQSAADKKSDTYENNLPDRPLLRNLRTALIITLPCSHYQMHR